MNESECHALFEMKVPVVCSGLSENYEILNAISVEYKIRHELVYLMDRFIIDFFA
jgi:hypothetical protein